jgi:D-3-phosphoglycerate dehydrogenase / 2-oxoglutarate reductase
MEKKIKVLYLGSIEGYESTLNVLSDFANVINVPPKIELLSDQIEDADAILDASMKTSISEELLKNANKLKIISCATTGSDHISTNALIERKISLKTLKEDGDLIKNITPAAELSWALLMACSRKLNLALLDVKNGNWEREKFPGIMLRGKTIGIIGCGRIGGWMATYATAFGMNVIGYDPVITDFPNEISPVSLESIFTDSDFISVHVHLSDLTRKMVSYELIQKCKKGVIIINTSRGQIIDEEALIDGLKKKLIGAVGLDVISDEPHVNNSAIAQYGKENDNVLITPHCGGFSPDAVKIVCRRAAEKIKIFFN